MRVTSNLPSASYARLLIDDLGDRLPRCQQWSDGKRDPTVNVIQLIVALGLKGVWRTSMTAPICFARFRVGPERTAQKWFFCAISGIAVLGF
jgi:hypothetical protein